jgi:hypothetical protein
VYEPRRAPLLPRPAFLRRLARNTALAALFVALSLTLGTLGYHFFGGLAWLDAWLNAAMILTGMGPVDPIRPTAGKLFAGAYALFSGVAFLTIVGVMLAPVVHRFLHRFHLETEDAARRSGDAP